LDIYEFFEVELQARTPFTWPAPKKYSLGGFFFLSPLWCTFHSCFLRKFAENASPRWEKCALL